MFIKYISIKYSIKYLSNINQISRFNFILLLIYSKVKLIRDKSIRPTSKITL